VYNQYKLTLTLEADRVASKKFAKPYNFAIDSTNYKDAVSAFDEAIDIFETIKKNDPKNNENLNLLLQAYVEAGRIDEATKTFKLAVENDPGNKTNHYVLGVLYRSIKNYDNAVESFKEALSIDPSFTDAAYEIGATYYNWGVEMRKTAQEKESESTEYKSKFQDALPWMEKVAKERKDDAGVLHTLGIIYTQLGQKEKAASAFEQEDKLRKAGK
jgi:pentatricopeptide repeat protein